MDFKRIEWIFFLAFLGLNIFQRRDACCQGARPARHRILIRLG